MTRLPHISQIIQSQGEVSLCRLSNNTFAVVREAQLDHAPQYILGTGLSESAMRAVFRDQTEWRIRFGTPAQSR